MEESLDKKALEEVQLRNMSAVADFSQISREMVLEQNKKIESLSSQVLAQSALLNEFRIQLAYLQAKLYQNGGE